jgi:hypothetical protein
MSQKEGSVAAVPVALHMSVRRNIGAGRVQSVHCLGRRVEGLGYDSRR